MAYWRLYYHLVWATKERQPLITPEIEAELYGYMIGKAQALECFTHGIGGKDLERAVQYALHQKEHHQQAQLIPLLERDTDEDDGPAAWNHGEAIAGITIIRE